MSEAKILSGTNAQASGVKFENEVVRYQIEAGFTFFKNKEYKKNWHHYSKKHNRLAVQGYDVVNNKDGTSRSGFHDQYLKVNNPTRIYDFHTYNNVFESYVEVKHQSVGGSADQKIIYLASNFADGNYNLKNFLFVYGGDGFRDEPINHLKSFEEKCYKTGLFFKVLTIDEYKAFLKLV